MFESSGEKRVAPRVLARFSRLIIRLYWSCLRKPGVTVGVLLALVAFLAAGLPRVKNVTAARDLFGDDTVSAKNYDRISKEFKSGNPVLAMLRPVSGKWNAEDLCALQKWLTHEELTSPEISKTSSAFDLAEAVVTKDTYRYRRVFEPCNQSFRSLDAQLAHLGDTPAMGTLVAPAVADFGVEISFRDTPGGSKHGRFDPKPIGELIQEFERDLGEKFTVVWGGAAMYDHHVAIGMKRFPMMNLGVLLLIVLLYRFYTGSWRSGLLLMGTLALTGVVVFGGMGWAGHSVDVLASTIFLMVTIAAHQDFSFVSSAQMVRFEDFRRTFRRFLVPSFFTSLSTMIGFYSLCLSDLGIIRRFGLWAGTGALFEWIMVMLFIPSLLVLLPSWRRWTKGPNRFLDHFKTAGFSRWLPSKLTARVLLGLILLAPWAVRAVNVTDDPKGLFPAEHPFRRSIAYIYDSRGWENTLDLLFPSAFPRESRKKILDQVAKLPLVARIEDETDLTDFLKRDHTPHDQAIIESQTDIGGISKRYRTSDDRYRAILYVKSSDLLDYRNFREGLAKICDGETCTASGLIDLYADYTFSISRTLAESLVVSLVLVTLLMAFVIRGRRAPHGVYLVIASFWGPLVMLIILAVFRIPLNVYTCNCAAVLVGLTGDNAIQFVFASRRGRLGEALRSRRDGAIFTSVTMALGCLVFLASAFTPPRILGLLLFFGFLFCLLGDYWLLKGLLSHSSGKDGDRPRSPQAGPGRPHNASA